MAICMKTSTAKTDSTSSNTFMTYQLTFERVQKAWHAKDSMLKKLFMDSIGVYPATQVYFRVIKVESKFEVWALQPSTNKYKLVKTYAICDKSGVVGPKREEGDRQVPEGFYKIAVFNPISNYHLSLGINYPNTSDSILTSNKEAPGGDIYIHGDCVTIGCIPLTDDLIKEVYLIAMYAKNAGQDDIPVHIFPFDYSKPIYQKLLTNYANIQLKNFWNELKIGFDYFNTYKKIPQFNVDEKGKYILVSH